MHRAALDHLVVAAATLEQGEDYLESRVGERPRRGGKHVAMGTHNSVLRIGQGTYLEVIAIDPEGTTPQRARWFELDRPAMQATLRVSPRLIHWVARCTDIDAARRACPADPGPAHAMSRGEFFESPSKANAPASAAAATRNSPSIPTLSAGPPAGLSRGNLRWRITIPDDGHLPGAGVLPTLIEWADARHPADAMPDSGLTLVTLAASHPEPSAMRTALAALGLADALQITFAATPRLAALLRTPRGPVTL